MVGPVDTRRVSVLLVADLARVKMRQITTRHMPVDAVVFEAGDLQRAEDLAVRLVLSTEAMVQVQPLGAWAIEMLATAFEWLSAIAGEVPDATPFGGLTPGAWPIGTAERILETLASSSAAAQEEVAVAHSLGAIAAAFGAHLADVLGPDDDPARDSSGARPTRCRLSRTPRSSPGQEAERGRGLDDGQRRVWESSGVAADDGVTAGGFGGCGAHRVLEVGPGEDESPAEHHVGDRRDGEDVEQLLDSPSGKRRPLSLLEDIEHRRHAVRGNDALTVAPFQHRPQPGCRSYAGLPVEDDVQQDVEVEENLRHRYFRSRWRRCALTSTPLPAP